MVSLAAEYGSLALAPDGIGKNTTQVVQSRPLRSWEILVAGLILSLFTSCLAVGAFRLLGWLPRWYGICLGMGIAMGPALICGFRLWFRLRQRVRPWPGPLTAAVWAVVYSANAYLILLGAMTMIKGLHFVVDGLTLMWNALFIGISSAIAGSRGLLG